jgi:hypothetical protein
VIPYITTCVFLATVERAKFLDWELISSIYFENQIIYDELTKSKYAGGGGLAVICHLVSRGGLCHDMASRAEGKMKRKPKKEYYKFFPVIQF